MEAGSEEEENNRISGGSPSEAPKKPKRQMKTPFQLETLEETYAMETYPSEVTRVELSEKLGLTDRQLQMWFCHRRLKDKKEREAMAMKPQASGMVGKKGLWDTPIGELGVTEPGSDHSSGSGSHSGSGSRSGSGSGSRPSQFDYGDDLLNVPQRYPEPIDYGENVPMVPKRYNEPLYYGDDLPVVTKRYHELPHYGIRRVIACVEEQLGEPIRKDGPILGMEFDEPPPGAFGAPIVMAEHQRQSGHSYDGKLFQQYDAKPIKAAMSGLREPAEPSIRSDAYGRAAPSYLNDSAIDGPSSKTLPYLQGNGEVSRGYGVQDQVLSVSPLSQQSKQGLFSSSPMNNDSLPHNEDVFRMERKRKSDDGRIGKEVQAPEKRIQKELEKQDLLRRKREEQMRKEIEKQDRERQKEEQRMIREKRRMEERCQREERREIERREKFLQKELLKAERSRQKEELRKEKEAVRIKAAVERATARRIAKESMEVIEDERLELMELAATKKGLPSIISLDYDTLQNLEAFRDSLSAFPPESVQMKNPFAIQPWIDSEDNIGNLLMVWRFCITFADVLGLWPFTLDEFVQALHDYETRLLGEIHIALLKLIIKDIEDVARTPSSGFGTNQYTASNPEGGHPDIVEGAYLWGFDIRSWQNHLNPLTWPEILRQFALSAGFGPQLKKKSTERACLHDNDEDKGCEDIVSNIRNGSAAENAVMIMQGKGFSLQRRSRHRLTPGTVKFAAYHVLSLEGIKGLTVIELADKIQKSGLRDLTTSKTPEASISVALSRDPILFERIAPSTYSVRPAFRKDPVNAEVILSAAREKIQRYVNGFATVENPDDVERDDDSECDVAEGAEVDDMGTPLNANKNGANCNEVSTCSGDGKNNISEDVALNLKNEFDSAGIAESYPGPESTEIDESRSGEPWVQGLTEGEYSDLCVDERLSALVTLIGVANEGNSIRAVLEDRLDAANALKKQMWAEAHLDKRRIKDDSVTKFHDSSFTAAAECSQSPLTVVDNKSYEASISTAAKEEPLTGADNFQNHHNGLPAEKGLVVDDTSNGQITSSIQQNGYTAERSRLQLKSFIGQRAEETFVYRSLPLGQDRRCNRYWQFVASASRHDPGSGRIFVESPDGYWRLIDSEEAFDTLLMSLDTRGIRESHLHFMLQKIETSFKENVQRNWQCAKVVGKGGNSVGNEAAEKDSSPTSTTDADSPRSAVCGSNSDTCEPSSSFKIELGRNETEQKNALIRYQDLQMWMCEECFNLSTLWAMTYGKKRCMPLLRICDFCLDTRIFEEELCPSCRRSCETFNDNKSIPERMSGWEEKKVDIKNLIVSDSSRPLRIRLLKALFTFLEVSVPSEAFESSWTENFRRTWGLKLHSSWSTEDLLQILTQFEGVIKRDCLSSNFETTEELLGSCALSGRSMCDSAPPGSVPHLPWIPQTTAAVALRLLELDASLSDILDQKDEPQNKNKVEDITVEKLPSTHMYLKNVRKVEPTDLDHGEHIEEEKWNGLGSIPGSSRCRQVVRGRGGGRTRGRWKKRVAGSTLESGRQSVRDNKTLSQVLMQQVQRTGGQRHGRGRRTVRRRRTEKVIEETQGGHLVDDKRSPNSAEESPRNSGGQEWIGEEIEQVQIEDDGNSTEESDSSDNNNAINYKFVNWGPGLDVASNRSTRDLMETSDEHTDGSEEENDYEEEDGNLAQDIDMDYVSNQAGDGNDDEGTDSAGSGDYSD
ncbi:unnamed protein product [Ilex paraguariensis]|uniref:Uncharacterized protein n=1 Tax=Ilex paraguariensis TaxID=185542 RepID=A0ABC8ULH3_9AQUA